MGLMKIAQRIDAEVRENRRIQAMTDIAEGLRENRTPNFCDICGKGIKNKSSYRCQYESTWTGNCNCIICKNCSRLCRGCKKYFCKKHFEKHKCKH